MSSVVLYSDEYDRAIDQGLLDPQAFDYWFLCEGDSWMDRSSIFQLSLPWALAKTFHGAKGNRALFINLARFGDTLRSIADCADGLFEQWLDTQGLPFQFDALLFSASGNDFIDAALNPGSGNGILHGVQGAPPGLDADDCYNVAAVDDLVGDVIDPAFAQMYDLVRSSRQPDLPILLNCYDQPVARAAPAFPGGQAWLSRAYQKNGIPPRLWPELTERIFIDVATTVTGWTLDERVGLHVVETTGVPLQLADPGSSGSSGDWLNEIHPNKSGWTKLVAAWQQKLDAVLSPG
jgi:hypothetical protein